MNISDTVDLILNIIYAVLIIWVALELSAYALIRYAKKYRWAISICTALVTINPFDATAFLNRSWAYLEVEEYQKVIQNADRIITLNAKFSSLASHSNLAKAYNNRAIAYRNLKQYERAIVDYDQAIALDPNYAAAYNNRGVTYRNLKQYERAIDDFNHTLDIKFGNTLAYYNRGVSFLGLGNIKQGLADFVKAQEISPTDIGHTWMAIWSEMCLDQAGEREAEKLEAIAAVDPKHHIAYICRGAALWLRGDFERSLIEQEQAILLKPDDCDAYFWAGMACASLGRDQEAIGALEHSLASGLPPVLLAPLRWFEKDKPEFYENYAKALLARYKGV